MVWSFTSFDVLRSERYGKYGQNGHCEKLVGPVWEGKPTDYMLGRMMWHGASLKVCLWQYRGTRATPDADGAIPHEHEFIDRCCLATWDTGRYKYWFLICPSGGKMWIWFSGVWKCEQGSIHWMAANTTPTLQSSSARGLLQVTVCQPVQNKQVPMLLGDKTINN